ncbi:MAG: hypothetical protein KatS3mg077_1311 [Candidatus Binatia bacterium]|nr:MAG: hypothetical protein KatS3mg077_1311 [Candidatus Binatia bacterium]
MSTRRWLTAAALGAGMAWLAGRAPVLQQLEPVAKPKRARSGTGEYFADTACPVVGNSKTKIYHLPHHPNYRQMLEKNRRKYAENRVCFSSEAEAQSLGYRRSRARATR